ncbi:Hypp1033 [Branchiostoma lanceolatum]|uniref:Hypp1033 protein n=1 Tax=Branchiostoma lanceolatum TaxID=7740 RepID=A0A8J9ZE19_BRALA|nr:Hypp1033 [Branchiostoma lanceolatum]
MMAEKGFLPVPRPLELTGDVAENWETFKEDWNSYEIATETSKKTAVIRSATLKTVMGRDCLDILKNLDIPPDPDDADANPLEDPAKIITALDKHFKPLRNTVYERYKFNKCDQAAGEKIEAYVARLRKLISTCDYGDLKDQMLRDRIVLGIRDSKVRMKLLKQRNLTLQAAIDDCKTSETTNQHMKAIQNSTETDHDTVHYARRGAYKPGKARAKKQAVPQTWKTSSAGSCSYCAKKHPPGRDACPAYGKECSACGKPNHFARACKSADQKQPRRMGKAPGQYKKRTAVHAVEDEDHRDFLMTINDERPSPENA